MEKTGRIIVAGLLGICYATHSRCYNVEQSGTGHILAGETRRIIFKYDIQRSYKIIKVACGTVGGGVILLALRYNTLNVIYSTNNNFSISDATKMIFISVEKDGDDGIGINVKNNGSVATTFYITAM